MKRISGNADDIKDKKDRVKKNPVSRDRQRSYPSAGITATEYKRIRLCQKYQDSVVKRDA